MHTAIKTFYSEQEFINKAINKCLFLKQCLEEEDDISKKDLSELIDFFNVYADLYHHNKEEKLLFPFLLENHFHQSNRALTILVDDHKILRELLHSITYEIEKKNLKKTKGLIEDYILLLADHINFETKSVLQPLESQLTHCDLELLENESLEFDRRIGISTKKYFENILV